MKYAILGDVHANLEAFEAVLEDARTLDVERFLCVGDIVGYNADPNECVRIVRELDCTTVRGNHDHYVCADDTLGDLNPVAANVVRWTRDALDDDHLKYLTELRMVQAVDGFTLVHSTLDMPEKWGYVFEEVEADASFNYQTTAVCFHGHTHVPVLYEKSSGVRRSGYKVFKATIGKKYFINVGSVGQPRDGDPRAAYVVYDSSGRDVELRRVHYDVTTAQEKILAAGLPRALAARLAVGK
jgi:diadenosine tetraphosphatase ApaH/serine/threonine PP2A family protein phosphatase